MKIHTKNSVYELRGRKLTRISPRGETMRVDSIISIKVGEPVLVGLTNGEVFRTSEVRKIEP